MSIKLTRVEAATIGEKIVFTGLTGKWIGKLNHPYNYVNMRVHVPAMHVGSTIATF